MSANVKRKASGQVRIYAAGMQDSFCRLAVLTVILLSAAVVPVSARGWSGVEADSLTVVRLLEASRSCPSPDSLPLFFARRFLGCPYVAHTLEGNARECLVVNTRQLDCTTLVETVTAFTLCARSGSTCFADYLSTLQTLRYRGGVLEDYTSRLHYFTEWITDNASRQLVEEIQQPVPPFTAVQTVDASYMSAHPESYEALRRHPEYLPSIRRMEQAVSGRKYRYIPKRSVADTPLLRRTVKDGDILAITCNKKGLEIAHLGFAVWRSDGLHLLNASMIHKKVVEEPMTLGRYLAKHPSHTGIRVVRICGGMEPGHCVSE